MRSTEGSQSIKWGSSEVRRGSGDHQAQVGAKLVDGLGSVLVSARLMWGCNVEAITSCTSISLSCFELHIPLALRHFNQGA